jgi:DNA (cytosine-5)-methyltransferase 1
MSESLSFVDLFCGIGGFHQALTKIGCRCVFASDIDEKCRNVFFENYGIHPEGDIRKVDIQSIPEFDILCSGLPCQSFSKAGSQKGFKDEDRGNLFFNICDIVKVRQPKYMIIENVRNLVSHDKGRTWRTIRENIISLGYHTYEKPIVLNVLHFNVPQNRERVVILCKRKDLGELPEMPSIPKIDKNNLGSSITDIIENSVPEKYKIKGKLAITEEVWSEFVNLLQTNDIDIPKFPIWTDWWDENIHTLDEKKEKMYNKYTNWINKNIAFYEDNKEILEQWLSESREKNLWIGAVRKLEWQSNNDDNMNTVLWSQRPSGIRVKKLNYSPALTAMTNIPIYGPESRYLTPRELCRLQSFPESFILGNDDKASYKQLGNAVNVKMIEACAKFLIYGENIIS